MIPVLIVSSLFLLYLGWWDRDTQRIPNTLLIVFALPMIIWRWVSYPFQPWEWSSLILLIGCSLTLRMVGTWGMGDVKTVAFLGAVAGPLAAILTVLGAVLYLPRGKGREPFVWYLSLVYPGICIGYAFILLMDWRVPWVA